MSTKRIERILKRLGLALLARWAPRSGHAPTSNDLEYVSRILVVKSDARIGNAVLITPLLVALKGRFDRAQLTCLLSTQFWELNEYLPSVDEFIPFEKRRSARNPFRFLRLVRDLRLRLFDLVFDASGDHEVSFTHLALTALSGGRFRIGHARGDAGRFYDVAVPVPETSRHAAEMHLDLLRAVTPIRSDLRPMLRPRLDSGFGETFLDQCGWSAEEPIVVIHPGARGRKRWPADRFAAVARILSENDVRIAVVWGPADALAAEDLMRRAGDAVRPAGILGFADLISLLRKAAVFLSADCGPMHLASAAGTPTIAIFLASDMEKYRPLGPLDTAIDGRRRSIPPEEVAQVVIDALRKRQTTRSGAPISRVQSTAP